MRAGADKIQACAVAFINGRAAGSKGQSKREEEKKGEEQRTG